MDDEELPTEGRELADVAAKLVMVIYENTVVVTRLVV